jgi:hypothetical protein
LGNDFLARNETLGSKLGNGYERLG